VGGRDAGLRGDSGPFVFLAASQPERYHGGMTNRTDAFGRALREARERAGVSQRELAKHLDVSGTFISDVERGHRTPFTLDLLARTAEFLGADLMPLLEARALWSGCVEIPLTGRPETDSLALGMAAGVLAGRTVDRDSEECRHRWFEKPQGVIPRDGSILVECVWCKTRKVVQRG
jgi:DNA-binding XRE family transcriptional regulator